MKIKRKQVQFKNIKCKDLNDPSAEEITNNAEFFMPTFLMRKGIRVTWDKEKSELVGTCYDIEYESQVNDEQIVKNFELQNKSNQKRIANEIVQDFRVPLVKDVFNKATTKFSKLQSKFDCKFFDKFNALLKPFSSPLAAFGNINFSVKDVDYLTNMDANMPLNWLDVKFQLKNDAKIEPKP